MSGFPPIFLALSLASAQGQSKEAGLSLAVVYNNVPYAEGLTTAWGMSCFIKGMAKNILFDTGGEGSILLSNMEKLGIDPQSVDVVFLSHIHGDHVGGLWDLLERKNDVVVYVPQSFPEELKSRVSKEGAKVVSVGQAMEICEHVHSTGEMSAPGGGIKEQSLLIDTPKGVIIVTGCAHPGVVNIVKTAQGLSKKGIGLLLGGFHLTAHSESEVRGVVKELKELGVEKVGPSHCTGERPIELFREAWGENFFDLGCGARIELGIGEDGGP